MRNLISKMLLIVTVSLFLSAADAYTQKVATINSEIIRKYYPDAKQAEQRIQSFVDEWNRDLEVREQAINALEFEIKKNRLIWTGSEKKEKEEELKGMINARDAFAKEKFTAGGEYDELAANMLGPIEAKIKAAVNEVAADYRFDIIIDQSITPLPYVNYKYDMTINVLRKLGVDTKELETELKEKIEKDPRNQQKKTRSPRGRDRSRQTRRRADTEQEKKIEEVREQENPGQNEEMPNLDLTPEQQKKMEEDMKRQAQEIEEAKKKREEEQKKAEEEGGEK